jgi:hypothetical protein
VQVIDRRTVAIPGPQGDVTPAAIAARDAAIAAQAAAEQARNDAFTRAIATVTFGTNVGAIRPAARTVIWIGDAANRVVPLFIGDNDFVIYPTPHEVVPAWSLTAVPGLAFDFNAANLTIADGDTVSGTWTDPVSGKTATHLSAATATLDADGLNGGPAVNFPNGGALQVTGFGNYSGPWTIFLLGQATAPADGDFLIDGVDSAGGVLKLGIGTAGGAWRAQRGTALAGPTADAQPHMIEVVFNGASSSIRVDSGPTTTGPTTSDEGFTTLIIGGRGGDTNRLTGKIARVIGVKGLVSETDRAHIRELLTQQSWSLSTVPGLAAWFDAQALTGAHGADMTTWPNRVTGASAAVPITSAPKIDAAAINGRRTVYFPDGGALRTDGYAAFQGAHTVYTVAVAPADGDFFFDAPASDGTPLKLAIGRVGGTWRAQRGASLNGATADAGAHIHCAVFDGQTARLSLDGGAPVSGAVDAATDVSSYVLGARADNSNRLLGHLGEVIVIRGLVSASDHARIIGMLRAKWGLN